MQNPTVHSHKILSNKIKTVLTDHFGSRFANQNILYFISAPYIPFEVNIQGDFFFTSKQFTGEMITSDIQNYSQFQDV